MFPYKAIGKQFDLKCCVAHYLFNAYVSYFSFTLCMYKHYEIRILSFDIVLNRSIQCCQ